MKTLATNGAVDELIARLESLRPDSSRQWGTLTAGEMVCHLADSFHAVLGERPSVTSAETRLSRTLVKYIALHTSLPWPKGVPTRPEVNPHKLGTRPGRFETDRAEVVQLVRRFAEPDPAVGRHRHPTFGALSRWEWERWGYIHVDHHLRQFGV